MSLIRFDAFGRRWFLCAPWHIPLWSERSGFNHKVVFSLFGWRITNRPLKYNGAYN